MDRLPYDQLDALTVVALKVALRERGLKVSGVKADLIARLQHYNAQQQLIVPPPLPQQDIKPSVASLIAASTPSQSPRTPRHVAIRPPGSPFALTPALVPGISSPHTPVQTSRTSSVRKRKPTPHRINPATVLQEPLDELPPPLETPPPSPPATSSLAPISPAIIAAVESPVTFASTLLFFLFFVGALAGVAVPSRHFISLAPSISFRLPSAVSSVPLSLAGLVISAECLAGLCISLVCVFLCRKVLMHPGNVANSEALRQQVQSVQTALLRLGRA